MFYFSTFLEVKKFRQTCSPGGAGLRIGALQKLLSKAFNNAAAEVIKENNGYFIFHEISCSLFRYY